MGWEQRGGRSYYYTAERIGGRVVKSYVGTGRVAELAAQLDAINRQEREAEDEDAQSARDELADLDAALAPLSELADLLARAALQAAGFHQHHRGEWRRRREQA
ncbi:MAG TPA: hypothetical protein VKE74_03695 [Gemmataceae bacterium]|nr:hypothetical protein [Gemmataceae bacterium]